MGSLQTLSSHVCHVLGGSTCLELGCESHGMLLPDCTRPPITVSVLLADDSRVWHPPSKLQPLWLRLRLATLHALWPVRVRKSGEVALLFFFFFFFFFLIVYFFYFFYFFLG